MNVRATLIPLCELERGSAFNLDAQYYLVITDAGDSVCAQNVATREELLIYKWHGVTPVSAAELARFERAVAAGGPSKKLRAEVAAAVQKKKEAGDV